MNNQPDKMRVEIFIVLLTEVISVCFGQMVSNIEDKNITTFRTAFEKDVLVLDINGSYLEIPLFTTTRTPEITTFYRTNIDETTVITEVPTTYTATNAAEPDTIATKETTPIIIPKTTIPSTTTASLITIASTTSTQTTTFSTTTKPTTTRIKPTTTKPTPTSQIILIQTVATKSISFTPTVDYKSTTRKIKLLKLCTKKRKPCKERKPIKHKVVKDTVKGVVRDHKKQCKHHYAAVRDTSKDVRTVQEVLIPMAHLDSNKVNHNIKMEEQYKGNNDSWRFRVFKCWIYQSCT